MEWMWVTITRHFQNYLQMIRHFPIAYWRIYQYAGCVFRVNGLLNTNMCGSMIFFDFFFNWRSCPTNFRKTFKTLSIPMPPPPPDVNMWTSHVGQTCTSPEYAKVVMTRHYYHCTVPVHVRTFMRGHYMRAIPIASTNYRKYTVTREASAIVPENILNV